MKPKVRAGNLFGNSTTLTALLVATFAAPAAWAGTIYWDGTTAGWDAVANWSTVAGATTPDPAAVPGIADDTIFNTTGVNGAETISLNANQSANSLTFDNTGTTLLQGNTVASANRVLTLGGGGITVNSGAGAVTIGSTTANQNVAITLRSSQSWINNSGNALNIVNAVTGLVATRQTLTIGGTGDTTWGAANAINAGTAGVLNLTKSGAGTLLFGVTSNGTANNLGGGVLNVAGGTVNIGARDLVVGGLTGSGTVGNGSATTRWLFVNNNADNLFSGTLQNGAGAGLLGLNKSGIGTLTLSGPTTYTSQTTLNGGTIEFGTTGSTGIARTVSSAAGLVFSAGDGAVKSSSDGTGTASLTIGNAESRTAGATANFIVAGGANGTSNSIRLTKAAGFIDQGSFFNGADYAVMDGLNTFVRGISYGADVGAVTSGTTATLAATAHQEITGAITAQDTAIFTTLKSNGNHAFTLNGGATVTTNGILKSGNVAGGATISGGTGIQAASGAEMVIRTDGPNDALTISTPIIANGASSLTKSGAGTLTLSGANTYTGATTHNAGTLTISGSVLNGAVTQRAGTLNVSGAVGTGNINIAGGVFNLSGSLGANATNGNFRVGTAAGTTAVMNILPGTVISARRNLFVGDAGAGTGGGAVYQTGGSMVLNEAAGIDNLRIGSNGGGYGYYSVSAGSVTSNRPAIGASLADTIGVVEVSGTTSLFAASEQIHVGAGSAGSSGLLNVTGGSATAGTDIRMLSVQAGTAGATSQAVVNVGGGGNSASVTTGNLGSVGVNLAQTNNVAGALGVLNLLPNGTLTAGRVLGTQANATTHFNFNGGTLKATAVNNVTIFGDATLDAVNVYSGGGTIDNSSTPITVNRGLLAPTGSGVSGSSLAVPSGGSGYIGAPLVKLTGGTGSGATGYAVILGGVVTSVVVTSPGIGYTPGDTLTATFFGGGATTVAADLTGIAVAQNTSGGMTFSGSGVTTLSGASTYTGATFVSAGTLLVNGSLANTAVTVQSGATIGGANGVIGTSSASVGVAAGATLAPGSAGLGALTVNGGVTIDGSFAYEYDGGTLTGDLLDVNGMLTLNNATLNLTDIGGNTYTLNDKFTLAAYDLLGVGSTFAGYADDSYFTSGGGSWLLNYNDATPGSNGGAGTNYVTITAIPEPAAALLGGLSLLALLRRRRES